MHGYPPPTVGPASIPGLRLRTRPRHASADWPRRWTTVCVSLYPAATISPPFCADRAALLGADPGAVAEYTGRTTPQASSRGGITRANTEGADRSGPPAPVPDELGEADLRLARHDDGDGHFAAPLPDDKTRTGWTSGHSSPSRQSPLTQN